MEIEKVKAGLKACLGDGTEIAPGVVVPYCEVCPYTEPDGTCDQLTKLHKEALKAIEELEGNRRD